MKSFDDLMANSNNSIFTDIDIMTAHLRLPYGNDMQHSLTLSDGEGIENIVFCGMGGSALAGNLMKNWLYARLSTPLEVVRGSVLPAYVNEHSLVFISSYSGNTKETLEAYEQANKNNVQIIVITNGGELLERAQNDNRTILHIPDAKQPRFAVLASLRASACALQNMGLISDIDAARELEDAADFLDEQKMTLSPDIDADNAAKVLAYKLTNQQVVFYASPLVSSSAYVWKISINEDAKQIAWYNTYSELDHNEIEGWQFPKEKNLIIVELLSKFEDQTMTKRVDITSQLLKDISISTVQAALVGSTALQELLYSVMLAGYTAGYMAMLNNIDPVDVKLISKLKSKLAE